MCISGANICVYHLYWLMRSSSGNSKTRCPSRLEVGTGDALSSCRCNLLYWSLGEQGGFWAKCTCGILGLLKDYFWHKIYIRNDAGLLNELEEREPASQCGWIRAAALRGKVWKTKGTWLVLGSCMCKICHCAPGCVSTKLSRSWVFFTGLSRAFI